MSTDTYFDFISPETHPLYVEMNKAFSQPVGPGWDNETRWDLHKAFHDSKVPRSYEPCRVAHVHNLTKDVNFYLWQAFENRWNGVAVSEENVSEIVQDWKLLYENSQLPGDDFEHEDISTPQEIEECLREYMGHYMYTRVD